MECLSQALPTVDQAATPSLQLAVMCAMWMASDGDSPRRKAWKMLLLAPREGARTTARLFLLRNVLVIGGPGRLGKMDRRSLVCQYCQQAWLVL